MGTCVSVLCVCVCVNSPPSLCMVVCYSDSDSFVRFKLGNRRFGLMFTVDPYISNSKTDPRDDPEIRTGSCSEDQTAIRIQNCIISCECLFLCYFVFTIISECLLCVVI